MKNIKALNKLLPLVAIGTIADCQSILEPTNRVLVKAGLQIFNSKNTYNYGLNELLKQTGLEEKLASGYKILSQDLAFTFSPILNASGRISHARESIALLLSATEEDAVKKANDLIAVNFDRKNLVKEILFEIETEAEKQFLENSPLIWLKGSWNKGLIGLIASRLVSSYSIPVVVVSTHEEFATGSLRAPEGYHLPNALSALPKGIFEKSGGHPGASGFTAKMENLEQIETLFKEQILLQSKTFESSQISYFPPDFKKPLPKRLQRSAFEKDIIWLEEEEIKSEFLAEIMALDPFGQDFLIPKLGFFIQTFQFKFMGSEENHAKITTKNFSVAIFNLSNEEKQQLKSFKQNLDTLWIIAKPSQNSWNGQTKWELIGEKILIQVS